MNKALPLLLGLFAMVLLPSYVTAAESDYKFCSIAGYAYGNQENYLGSLAAQLTIRKGIADSALCRAAHKAAYEIGERFARTGISNAGDLEVINQFTEFRRRINDAILRTAGY